MIQIDSRFGLAEALEVGRGDMISLVGAGGKTTVLYGLTLELRRRGLTVIATTTTHIQTPRLDSTMPPLVFAMEERDWMRSIRARIDRYGSVTAVGSRVREDKLRGLAPEQIEALREVADCILIEADGARSRSLKVPASHEPVIPSSTTLTVVVGAIDALDRPLDGATVHRLEEVLRVGGAAPGAPITAEMFARILLEGYLHRAPATARVLWFVNKVDDGRLKDGERVGELLLEGGASEVVFGEARRPHECFYRMAERAG